MLERSATFSAFQLLCAAVVVLTLRAMSRARPAREVARELAALAVAGFLGEETCIALYGFYAYAPGWHLRIHHVPLLVPLIWPLVILSARDVVGALLPRLGAVPRAAAVACGVAIDAALIEVLSVRAGFWSWAEPGLSGVPIIGILGWSYFAFGATLALELPAASARTRAIAVVLVGPAVAHLMILASWWGCFRWILRGELGGAAVAVHVALLGLVTAVVARARRAGRSVPPRVWQPRLAATALFVLVFAATAIGSPAHAAILVSTAAPYLAAMRLGSAVKEDVVG